MDKEQAANKNQSEVTYKIKCAIKKKLLELIDFDDEELPEYIMILIANKKSKDQIENDLQLFLGDKTSDFTNWLLDLLNSFKNSESVKSNNETICSEKNEAEPDEDALLLLDCDPDEKAGDLFSLEDTNDSVLSKSSNLVKCNVASKTCDLKSNNEKVSNLKKLKEKNKLVENPKTIMYTSRNPLPSAVISVKKEMMCDSEYDPTKPDYASSSNNPRKFGVHGPFQASKLLLKAVDDATKSILKGKSVPEFYKPTPIKVLTSKRYKTSCNEEKEDDDDDLVKKARPYKAFCNVDDDALVEKELSDSKMGEQSEINDSKNIYIPDFGADICLEENYSDFLPSIQSSRSIYLKSTPRLADDTRLRNSLITSNNILTFDEEICPVTPRFTVTLDGISVNPFKRKLDEISLDSFEDEGTTEEEPSDKKQKVIERCKFWPACKNSNYCMYHHPTVACKCFPDCKYGDKCLYIHPNCKFDALCSRKDCPFTHASKRKLSWICPMPVKMKPMKKFRIKTVCKFYPNCTSKSCVYIHPKMCRYGVECRAPNCLYGHYLVPARNQMRWQARYF